MLKFFLNVFKFLNLENSYFERIRMDRMVRMVRMVRSLADRTFQLCVGLVAPTRTRRAVRPCLLVRLCLGRRARFRLTLRHGEMGGPPPWAKVGANLVWQIWSNLIMLRKLTAKVFKICQIVRKRAESLQNYYMALCVRVCVRKQ